MGTQRLRAGLTSGAYGAAWWRGRWETRRKKSKGYPSLSQDDGIVFVLKVWEGMDRSTAYGVTAKATARRRTPSSGKAWAQTDLAFGY